METEIRKAQKYTETEFRTTLLLMASLRVEFHLLLLPPRGRSSPPRMSPFKNGVAVFPDRFLDFCGFFLLARTLFCATGKYFGLLYCNVCTTTSSKNLKKLQKLCKLRKKTVSAKKNPQMSDPQKSYPQFAVRKNNSAK